MRVPADLMTPPPTSLPSEARAALLREADRVLRDTENLDEALTAVAKLLVPRVSDICVIDLVEKDSPFLRRVASVFASPDDAQLAQVIDRYPLPAESAPSEPMPLRAGEAAPSDAPRLLAWTPELTRQIAWNDEQAAAIEALHLEWVLHTKLVGHGRPLGYLALGLKRSGRAFSAADAEFLYELGMRVGATVHSAQAFQSAELARQRAETAAAQLVRLQEIGTRLSEAVTTAHVSSVILEEGMAAFGASRAALGLIDFEDDCIRIARSIGYPSELLPLFDAQPLTQSTPLTDAVRTRKPIFLSDGYERLEHYPSMEAAVSSNGSGGMVTLPLETGGQRLGAVGFNLPTPHVFNDEERAFAMTFARQCSQALERVRLFEAERDARRSAERTAARIARMQAMTAELAAALDPDDVARVTLEHAVAELGADYGCVFRITSDGSHLELMSAHGLATSDVEKLKQLALDAELTLTRVVKEKKALWNPLRKALVAKELLMPCVAGIPLLVNDDCVVGVLGIGFKHEEAFNPRDREYCLALAQQAAQGLERARLLAAERDARRREEAARKEAESANALKDQFLATLSHELRTPLTVIVAWSQQVMDRGLTGAALERAMSAIERNAKLQTRLVEDLLDVSRIVHGKLVLDSKRLALGEVAKAAVQMVEKRAEMKGVRLQFDPGESDLEVFGDPQRLDQVVSNLLANGIKFTPAGGSVTLSLRREGESAHIDVIDTGAGIKPEFLPHLFDRFRQEDGSSQREHGGLGLGLSIVRHLVSLHGGTVCAHSDGKGKGATFTVTLPLLKAD